MMPTTLTIDTQPLLQRLQALEAAVVPTLAQALYTRAQRIMAASRPLVPVAHGALRGSALVYPPAIEGTTITVVFGYGGQAVQYAAAVHDNPRAGKTGGWSPSTRLTGEGLLAPVTPRRYPEGSYATTGQWHFLSDPVRQVQATYAQDVASMMRALLTHGVRPQGD